MKILIFHDVYEHIGGAETYVHQITEGLKEKVEVYSIYQSFATCCSNKNFAVYLNKKTSLFKKYLTYHVFDLKFYKYIKNILKEKNPDIIHLNHNNIHYSTVLLALKNYPKIQTIHDYGPVCPKIWAINKKGKICYNQNYLKCLFSGCLPWWSIFYLLNLKIKNILFKKEMDLIIAPSENLKKILMKGGFKKIKVLNYFIDLKKWKKMEKHHIFEKRKKTLLYVGGLTKQKGIQILINAVDALPYKNKKDIILQIVGTGDYEKELKKMVIEKNLSSQIFFLGYRSGEDLRKLYGQAYAFIIPSIWLEQFGIVGLEAMACSTPVIGSNIGGIPEWLNHNQNGQLFEPGNFRDLAKKLKFLLDNPVIAEKYGLQGRDIIEKKFSKEKHINNLIRIYTNLIKQNGK